MTLYRAKPSDGVAWITGASSGIGRQLALDLARAGYTVAATARARENLDALAAEAERSGARVVAFPGDVTDETEMSETVARIEADLGAIALAVFNAGVYVPTHGDRLRTKDFVTTFNVNVLGTVYGLVPLLEHMKKRGYGHIVLVGSMTAYFGLPAAAAYGASKAALNSMAQSLKYDLDRINVRIQVANPGFVDTPATAGNKFKMPALMPVDKATARLVAGIASREFEIVFPRRLGWILKAGTFLPQMLFHRLVRRATGWDRRKTDRSAD
jgi:NAD(P)-dependent dehydrogenase (short-subunit alcohol dehydrogenase family)